MKKVLSILLALTLVLALAACGGSSDDGAEATSEAGGAEAASEAADEGGEAEGTDGSIKVGVLAPLTGAVSQYGIASSNGTLLAIEEINAAGGILGAQIEYVLEDEKGDATEALNAYNKLITSDGIDVLVGDVTTKPSIAVAQKAVEDGIPMITPTGTGLDITTGKDNVFRGCFTDPYQGELMADFAQRELSAAKVAILYDTTDDYSQGVADAFEAKAGELGMEVVAKEGYETTVTDFNAQLTKIKDTAPDVVMAPCYYEAAALIIAQARNIGITVPMLGPDGWDGVLDQMDESNYGTLDNCYYASQHALGAPNADVQAFKDSYVAKYGEDEVLSMFSALGYESMYLMAAAIEEAGSIDAEAVVAAMKNLSYDGMSSNIAFNGGNDPTIDAVIIQFADGGETVLGTYSIENGLSAGDAAADDAGAESEAASEADSAAASEAGSEAASEAEAASSEAESEAA